jgi:hypothetical protein
MRHAREENEMHAAIWWENLMGKDHLKGIDCRIILKLAVKKQGGKVGSGYLCSAQGPMVSSLTPCHEHLGFI